MKTITLSELGKTLPFGLDGKDNSFSFKDWTMEEEKYISKLKSESLKKSTYGVFINKLLAYMLTDIMGESGDSGEESIRNKMLIISQMELMDVLYLYTYLRYDQVDNEMRLSIKCPYCDTVDDNLIVDLSELDVVVKDGDEDQYEYKLKKPIMFNDQNIESFVLRRTKFEAFEKCDPDDVKMTSAIYKYSIIGVNGEVSETFLDVENIIKKLKKVDMNRLDKIITEKNGGPSFSVETECKNSNCKSTIYKNLEWDYDNFFGPSSLPQN